MSSLAMHGYGWYVWSSYTLVLGVLGINVQFIRWQRLRINRMLRNRLNGPFDETNT